MATIAKTISTTSANTESRSLSKRYDAWIEKLKFSYYGIITMTMTIGSCLGAIATMYVFENDAPLWQFVLAMMVSMANNVAAIAQAPMKWVANLFFLNVIVTTALIIANFV